MLFESDEFVNVVRKIEESVERCKIKLRSDKQLWADIGMSLFVWLTSDIHKLSINTRTRLNCRRPFVDSSMVINRNRLRSKVSS